MFTGIIEEVGVIKEVQHGHRSMQLAVSCTKVLEDVAKGDSIAVDGVCLTVVEFTSTFFRADVMPETFASTTLSAMKPGSHVNLERAISANGRFGGHFVSGHVDQVGEIVSIRPASNAVYVEIRTQRELLPYIMEKGSIAIDGTSLTIFAVKNDTFTISLIPATQKDSQIGRKKVGAKVNIECDILVKYMDRLIFKRHQETLGGGLSMDILAANGFLK
ncbi:riboflavin synthase [Sporosarcina sp. Te-1]|uniref:riboflavin synthase n=1 Tax=Sporosarcina sp. Te-1 TaxID=2818390 RepID=UPI001A9D3954|nr:riboflavin synthase [Sporosarcina sp. Te-1]QTD42042.1 riboflavin synthase [Sporosarcina sp. Te-1]